MAFLDVSLVLDLREHVFVVGCFPEATEFDGSLSAASQFNVLHEEKLA